MSETREANQVTQPPCDRAAGQTAHPFTVAFDAAGLVPVVAQDEATGDVLLLAYMNAEALRRTLAEGMLVLWSRSRGALWRKGEQSGNTVRLRELRVNCEGNSLLARVALAGPGACHDGYRSCYYRHLDAANASGDGTLQATIVALRMFDPAAVYGATHVDSRSSADTQPVQTAGEAGEAGLAPTGGDMPGEAAAPATPDPQPAQAGFVAAGPPDAVSTASLPTATETDVTAAGPSLERDARELYAAYERLRDGDLIPGSNTSVLLHRPDRAATIAHCLERAREELAELRGALDGTHRHTGGAGDIVLEASQVGYWTMLAAIASGHPYDAWRPHEAWLAGYQSVQSPPATAAVEAELAECAALLVAAGAICRAAGVHPAQVVAADLAAMRKKHAAER